MKKYIKTPILSILTCHIKVICIYLVILVIVSGCKKFVQIPPPRNTITTSEVFSDSLNATAAIEGIYSNMQYGGTGGFGFGSGDFTAYCGMSADELYPYYDSGPYHDLVTNTLTYPDAGFTGIWDNGFTYLYQANAAIEGLQNSSTLNTNTKNSLTGEAKWFRAFINFYLVNLYGDLPLITSTDFKTNALAKRVPTSIIYQEIINDLTDAQNSLPSDFSAGQGQRVRVNKWAAMALLARANLYLKNYKAAFEQTSSIINNTTLFSLVSDPSNVFLANSTETILQWRNDASQSATYNATAEGWNFIPQDNTFNPNYYVTNQLVNSFEPGDKRFSAWVLSYVYTGDGNTYYIPYKYKIGPNNAQPNASSTEYYTVLRLAEQYLIRAEAEAYGQGNGLPGAIADLNIIRFRAGLPNLLTTLNQTQVLAAIAQERRIEFCFEWGHRWMDLKRSNQVANDFRSIPYKSSYISFQQLYPIELSELQSDPNLTQNPGY